MAPLELEHISEEVERTKNWSNHRKTMFGMGLMTQLSISDGSVSADKNASSIIPASDRPLTTEVVDEALERMVKYGEVPIIEYILEPVSTDKMSKADFAYVLELTEKPGIQYILNQNLWLKVMDDEKHTPALVVTGDNTGNVAFFTEHEDNNFLKSVISFTRNGIYRLDDLATDKIYLEANAIHLN